MIRPIASVVLGVHLLAGTSVAQDHVFELLSRTELASIGVERMIASRIAELTSGGPEERADAREAVRRLGWRAAVPLLQREIQPARNRSKSLGALLSLDGIGGEEVIAVLRRVLLDEKFGDRERLAAALIAAKVRGRPAARLLGEAMRQGALKDEVRIGLALAAARLADRTLVPAVRRLAPRPFAATPVWAAVALALAELEAAEAEVFLATLARSNSPRIRRVACLAAARFEGRASLAVLGESLRFERNDPGTAACGLVALGIRQPEGVRTVLLQLLGSSEDVVREHAALALGWAPDQGAAQALAGAFAEDRSARARAATVRALARHRDPTLLAAALSDASAEVRVAAMLLAVHAGREPALRAIDNRLARETDAGVIATGLSVRLALAGRPLPLDHRLRAAVPVSRVLRESVWQDLDRYPDEPGAPAWRWALEIHAAQEAASDPMHVRARLLDAVTLELLDLVGEFEMPERRVVTSWQFRPSVLLGRARGRASPNFDRFDEDLKVWLNRRPFFAP
ncbi:MAG: HEAT repeat domain-containing protein [Planctomycetes bacterium]|nr:HEAT repeat domain-containing protein [Planctomycetota bacterium]